MPETFEFHAQPVTKGDQFRVDDAFVEVTRVGRSAPWVDIRVCTWAVMWTKRMPAGVPASWVKSDWTVADVEASEPEWVSA